MAGRHCWLVCRRQQPCTSTLVILRRLLCCKMLYCKQAGTDAVEPLVAAARSAPARTACPVRMTARAANPNRSELCQRQNLHTTISNSMIAMKTGSAAVGAKRRRAPSASARKHERRRPIRLVQFHPLAAHLLSCQCCTSSSSSAFAARLASSSRPAPAKLGPRPPQPALPAADAQP